MTRHNEPTPQTLPDMEVVWTLLRQSPVLWWDVDPARIDSRAHAAWIIARVLEFGRWEDHVALFQLYSHDTIESALPARRVPESIRAFWQHYFMERKTHQMHRDTLHPSTAALWSRLGPQLCLPEYLLAGGTAMALYLGHRESNDLDFMTSTAQSADTIISQIQAVHPSAQIIHTSAYSVHAALNDVRVSYLWQPGIQFDAGATVDGIPLASLDTLAALKCNAIANRGARKDFVDMYALLQAGWSLSHILEAAQQHAPTLNIAHLLRSMTYFNDAEQEPMPKLYRLWQWPQIRSTLEQAVHVHLNRHLSPKPPSGPSGPRI